MITNDALRAQIHAKQSEASLRDGALASGMVLMREDGERLVQLGITRPEELLRVTRD
jgi:general secretion pathway protein E